ncbi:MAG: glycosyltransferase family 1 protein [Chitinophagales bacterium]
MAINCRFVIENKMEGLGFFSYEMACGLAKAHPDVAFDFLFDRTPPDWFSSYPNVTVHVLWPPARHPLLWWWWFEIAVARFLQKSKPEVFLSPDGYVSLRSATPTVAVQHDIAFEHFPEHVSPTALYYYRYFVPKFMHHAARIATVSTFSKNDIAETYGIEQDKIDVVYNAPQEQFEPLTEEEIADTRATFSAGAPYFFYVGSINPRKNLPAMLRAFDQYKATTVSATRFIIAGAMGWQNSDLEVVLRNMQHRSDVIFTGRADAATLRLLMGSALAFCYVSLFEGFGVPPLEAMAAGVPVLASTASSLPEVCGDAALLVAPDDMVAIAAAMKRLAEEEGLRAVLIARGREQCCKFSLANTAAALWQSCLRAVQQ